PVEIGDEVLDPRVGVELVDLADGLRVEPGPAILQVVARDARDGGVAQTHLAHGLGHAPRLVTIEGAGLAGVDLAEVAAAGALLAADEERGLPVLPTLVDVGAAGLLAHRVQAAGLDQRLEFLVLGTHGGLRTDPRRLALD